MEVIDQVDGWIVNRVEAGLGATVESVFRQTGAHQWVRQDSRTGATEATYEEAGRDDHSVYLNERGSDAELAIGITSREIVRRGAPDDESPLFDVIRATAEISGLFANRVSAVRKGQPSTSFRQVGSATWVELPHSGGAPEHTYSELARRDESITLHDPSRDHWVELDVEQREVRARDGAGAEHVVFEVGEVGIAGRCSVRSDDPCELTFDNRSAVEADMWWVDFLGNEIHRGALSPGACVTVATFVGHVWTVRERLSRRRLIGWEPDTPVERVEVTTDGLRSTGGDEVQVTVKNLYVRPVDLVWLGVDDEESLGTLAPGHHRTLSAQVGDVIRVLDEGLPAGVLLVGADARQYRTITSGPARRPDATVTFRNGTPLDVELEWHGPSGAAVRFHGLAPGESVDQPVVAGERWAARDAASGRVLQEMSAPAQDTELLVTTLALRPEPTSASVTTEFVNDGALAGRLFVVDPAGVEEPRGLLRPKESRSLAGTQGDVWRFREAATGRELAVHCSTAAPTVRVDLGLRAVHSRRHSLLRVENRTLLTVELSWIDALGVEHTKAVVPPWAQVRVPTFLTHPWVVRERDSRMVLDVLVTRQPCELIVVDAADLARTRPGGDVAVELHNRTGFSVEVVDLIDASGDPLLTLGNGEEAVLHRPRGHSFGFRDAVSQSVFATYTAGPEAEQGHGIELTSRVTGTTTQLVVHNDSSVDVDVYRLVGRTEELVAQLDPRHSARLDTLTGEAWLMRERRTGMVLAATVATVATRSIRLTTGRLRPIEDAPSVQLSIVNTSGMTLDATTTAMTAAGASEAEGVVTLLGRLEPGDELQTSAHFSQLIRFHDVVSGEEVDLLAVGQSPTERYEVQNRIVAHELPPDGLRSGQVALYPEPDFAGSPIVAHTTLHDIASLGLSAVGSIRVGPSTGVAVHSEAGLSGTNDVFHVDVPALTETDVGTAVASLSIFGVAVPSHHVTKVSSDLVTAYRVVDGALAGYRAYRSVVTLPPEVRSVQVWATEELTVDVGKRTVTLDPVAPVTLEAGAGGVITFTTAAHGLGSPALMVRTDAMRPGSRFFVHPDADALRRLAELPPGALYESRERLGLGSDRLGDSEEDRRQACAHVQQALQQLAGALAPTGSVTAGPRTPRATGMDYDCWSLTTTSDGPRFAPLTPDQAAVVPLGTPADDDITLFLGALARDFDRAVVRPASRAAQTAARQVATTVDRAARDSAATVRAVGLEVDRTVIKPTVKAVEDHVIEPAAVVVAEAARAVDQAVDAASKVVDDAVDDVVTTAAEVARDVAGAVATVAGDIDEAVDDVADDVNDALAELDDVVLALTTEVGDTVTTVVIDTAEKVAAAVTAVVETVGGAIDGFIEFLGTALDWDRIVDTHDLILDLAEQAFDRTPEMLDFLTRLGRDALDSAGDDISSILERTGQQLGAIRPNTPTETAGPPAGGPDLDWLVSEVLGALTTESETEPLSAREAGALAALTEAVEAVEGGFVSATEDVGSTVLTAIDQILSSPPDELAGRVMGLLLEMVRGLAQGLVEVTAALLDALVALIAALLDRAHRVLSAPVEIPVVSDLYAAKVGRRPTMLSLMCLVVAVPTSIAGVALSGETWPPHVVTLSVVPAMPAALATTLKAIDIGLHVVKGVFDLFFIAAQQLGGQPVLEFIQLERIVGPKLLLSQWLLEFATHLLDFPGYGLVPALVDPASADMVEAERRAFVLGWVFGGASLVTGLHAARLKANLPPGSADRLDRFGVYTSILGNVVTLLPTIGLTVRQGRGPWTGLAVASQFLFDAAGLVRQPGPEAALTTLGHGLYVGFTGVRE